MNKTIPMLALGFFLVSCDALEGSLKVTQELSVQAKKTGLFQSGTKPLLIPPATYKAKLNPTSNTNFNLEIKVAGKDQKIPFKIAKGTKIPEVEGTLEISASESGQPYDLSLAVRTEQSRSGFERNESCVAYYEPVKRCYTTPASRVCREILAHELCGKVKESAEVVCRMIPATTQCEVRPAVTRCQIDQVPVYGSQLVSYEKVIRTKFIDVDLLAGATVVGQFDHVSTTANDIRLRSTVCR